MSETHNDSHLVKMTLDGREIEATVGELVIQAAERAGAFIPRFCYHPRMSSVGVCRMCLVEVKGPRGFSLQPACYLSVSAGMEVVTTSEKVKKAQDGVLEFLLINHPLDCPVCDKGGECPLQDQVLAYGPGESRFVEEKRHFEKPIALSHLVYLDRERCIQCDRCTRFASEVALDPLIDFVGRGDQLEINTFPDKPFSSYFSGNTVQICPVGALTAKPYRFKARPWDLNQTESTCTTCALGCRIAVQFSRGELTRYIGLDSDAINHSWLCDRGRFSYEAVNSTSRVVDPMARFGEQLVKVSWRDALLRVGTLIRRFISERGPESIGFIGGSHFTNEGLYSFVKLAKEAIGTDNFDATLGDGFAPDLLFNSNRATIDTAMSSKVLLVVAGDIREELPVLFLRVAKAAKLGMKIIEISPFETSISQLADIRIDMTKAQFLQSLIGSDSKIGSAIDLIQTNTSAGGEGLSCLIGQSDLGEAPYISDAIAQRCRDMWPSADLLFGMSNANIFGAYDMGAVSGYRPGRKSISASGKRLAPGLSMQSMLENAANGEMLLFVLAEDLFSLVPNSDLIKKALSSSCVVVIESYSSSVTDFAEVVLPLSAFGETGGTTTNLEGRVSRMGQALVAKGYSKPDYLIAAEINRELGFEAYATEPDVIFEEMVANLDLYRGLSYDALGSSRFPDGIVVPLPRTTISVRSSSKLKRLDPIATPGVVSTDRQGPPSADDVRGSSEPEGRAVDDSSSKEVFASTIDPFEVAKRVANHSQEGYRLVIARKLYSPDSTLMNSEGSRDLVIGARMLMSPETMMTLGVFEGSMVKITSSSGVSVQAQAHPSQRLEDDIVIAELGLGADFLSLVDRKLPETFVKLGVV